MYLIGLTGNIATGKTSVLDMLAGRGALPVDADRVTREVTRRGQPAWEDIRERFGAAIMEADGEICRPALARIVFSDPAALRDLERIVHPRVRARVDEIVAADSAPVGVIEAIKLIESGMAARCQAVWVTTCSERHQLRRLLHDRGLDEEDARRRMAAQPDPGGKVCLADVLLVNEGTRAALGSLVEREWRETEAGTAPGQVPQPEAERTGDGSWLCREGEHRAYARSLSPGEWRLESSSPTRMPRLLRPLVAALAEGAPRLRVPRHTGYCQCMNGLGFREVEEHGAELDDAIYRR